MQTLDNKQHWSIAQLGYQHFERGRLNDARTIFEGLITLEPQYDYGWRILGEIAQKQNQHDVAIEYFKKSMQINGNDPGHRVALVQLYLQNQQRDAAWELLSPMRAYFQRPKTSWEDSWHEPLAQTRALLKAHFQITV